VVPVVKMKYALSQMEFVIGDGTSDVVVQGQVKEWYVRVARVQCDGI
jgi:hypothetical protein